MTYEFAFAAKALLVSIAVVCGNAELLVWPRDTFVVRGNSTYLNCSTNGMPHDISWHHYETGSSKETLVYSSEQLHPPYTTLRIAVEKTSGVRLSSANLVFASVADTVAGKYVCRDGESNQGTSEAQLTVLESLPICEADISGVIVQNKCGFGPERFVMSCRVSYQGNISPSLEWTKLGSLESLSTKNDCSDHRNAISCRLTLKAGQVTDGVSYVCRILNSAGSEYSCSTEKFQVISVIGNTSVVERRLNEEISCLPASSMSFCTYKWHVDNIPQIFSLNLTIMLTEPGRYRCEAECRISNNSCSAVTVVVDVADQNAGSTKAISMFSLLAAAVCVALVTVIVAGSCIKIRRKHRNKSVGEGTYSVKHDSEAGEDDEELDNADEFDDIYYWNDCNPDNTVTSSSNMRTDPARCPVADILITQGQPGCNLYSEINDLEKDNC